MDADGFSGKKPAGEISNKVAKGARISWKMMVRNGVVEKRQPQSPRLEALLRKVEHLNLLVAEQ